MHQPSDNTQQSTYCCKCGGIPEANEINAQDDSNTTVVTCDSASMVKCQQWLEKCSLSDGDAVSENDSCATSQTESSFSEDVEGSACELLRPQDNSLSQCMGSTPLFESNPNTYGDVKISNSRHVVIGNVTYVNGPVHITQATSNVVNQLFLEGCSVMQRSDKLRIISRINWLAQPARNKTPLPEPVKFVVIGHTATEEGFTQAENTLLVGLVQTFHIESHKWDDVAYNFLIGSDGNVYEGRGWDLQGAHTYGYNKKSIGIAFVGCFLKHLPSPSALIAAKALIKHGVAIGKIPEDYILVGHCQCSPIESPGRRLYEEIKTWPHWQELTEEDSH